MLQLRSYGVFAGLRSSIHNCIREGASERHASLHRRHFSIKPTNRWFISGALHRSALDRANSETQSPFTKITLQKLGPFWLQLAIQSFCPDKKNLNSLRVTPNKSRK